MFKIKFFETIDSTNTYLKSSIADCSDVLDNNVIVAKTQTSGRGKLGRKWESGVGNLYTSIAIKQGDYFKDFKDISLLTIITCLSIGNTVAKYINNDNLITYKWPNDVFLQGAKVSGTLLEIEHDKNGVPYLIIGIGININYTPIINNYKTISIKDITNKEISVDYIIKDLLLYLAHYLEYYRLNKKQEIVFEWKNKLLFLGENIEIAYMNNKISGVFKGVNDDGYMILTKDNKDSIITAGDIFGIDK